MNNYKDFLNEKQTQVTALQSQFYLFLKNYTKLDKSEIATLMKAVNDSKIPYYKYATAKATDFKLPKIAGTDHEEMLKLFGNALASSRAIMNAR